MAFRAQADISNMEFVQFHPTGFWTGSQAAGSTFLISEAVRGEGERQLGPWRTLLGSLQVLKIGGGLRTALYCSNLYVAGRPVHTADTCKPCRYTLDFSTFFFGEVPAAVAGKHCARTFLRLCCMCLPLMHSPV